MELRTGASPAVAAVERKETDLGDVRSVVQERVSRTKEKLEIFFILYLSLFAKNEDKSSENKSRPRRDVRLFSSKIHLSCHS